MVHLLLNMSDQELVDLVHVNLVRWLDVTPPPWEVYQEVIDRTKRGSRLNIGQRAVQEIKEGIKLGILYR